MPVLSLLRLMIDVSFKWCGSNEYNPSADVPIKILLSEDAYNFSIQQVAADCWLKTGYAINESVAGLYLFTWPLLEETQSIPSAVTHKAVGLKNKVLS